MEKDFAIQKGEKKNSKADRAVQVKSQRSEITHKFRGLWCAQTIKQKRGRGEMSLEKGVPACPHMNSLQSLFPTLPPLLLSPFLLSFFKKTQKTKKGGKTSQHKLASAYKRLDFVGFSPSYFLGTCCILIMDPLLFGRTSPSFHLEFFLSFIWAFL